MKQSPAVLPALNSSKSHPLPPKPPSLGTNVLTTTTGSAPLAPNGAEKAKPHTSDSTELSHTDNASSVGDSGSSQLEGVGLAADTSTDNVVKPPTPPSPERPLGLQSSAYLNPPSLARRAFLTELDKLPLYSYLAVNPNRRSHYIRSSKDFKAHTDRFLSQGVTVVGFDLEWKPMRTPTEYNRVSLVQIASENEVLLIQITGLKHFPPDVKQLLENPDILKVGAGIANDVEKLAIDWSVSVANYMDLADLARSVDPFWAKCDASGTQILDGAFGIELPINVKNEDSNANASNNSKSSTLSSSLTTESETSEKATNEFVHLQPNSQSFQYRQGPPIALVRLVARYQGRRLDKECQLSNWAAPLNKLQVEYAANDGYAGLDVYHAIMKLRHAMASNMPLANSILTMGMLHTPNYLYDNTFSAPPAFTLAPSTSVNNGGISTSTSSWLPPNTSFNSHSSTSTSTSTSQYFRRRRRRASKSPKTSPTSGRPQPAQEREDITPQKVYPSPPDTPSSSAAEVDMDVEQVEDSTDVEDVDGNLEYEPGIFSQQWTEEFMAALPSISENTSNPGAQTIVPILSNNASNAKAHAPPSSVHTRKHSTGQYLQYPLAKHANQALPLNHPVATAYYPHLLNLANPAQPPMPYYLPTPPTQVAHPSQPSQPAVPPASHVPGYAMAMSYQQWQAQAQVQAQSQLPLRPQPQPQAQPQPQHSGMWISLPNLGDRRMTWHAGLPGYSYPASAVPGQPNPNPTLHHPQHSFTWPPANHSSVQTPGFYTTYPIPTPAHGSYYGQQQQQQQQYAAGASHPSTAQAQIVSTEGDGSGWITGITLSDTHKNPRTSQVSQGDATKSKPLIYS